MAPQADMRRCPPSRKGSHLLWRLRIPHRAVPWLSSRCLFIIGRLAVGGLCKAAARANADWSPDGGGIHPATALPYFGQPPGRQSPCGPAGRWHERLPLALRASAGRDASCLAGADRFADAASPQQFEHRGLDPSVHCVQSHAAAGPGAVAHVFPLVPPPAAPQHAAPADDTILLLSFHPISFHRALPPGRARQLVPGQLRPSRLEKRLRCVTGRTNHHKHQCLRTDSTSSPR